MRIYLAKERQIMKCKKLKNIYQPKTFSDRLVRCGQCTPCRITRAGQWIVRIELHEQFKGYSDYTVFINLTYNDDYLPDELKREHATGFIKRLKDRWKYHTGKTLQYFLVGEYGTRSGRPHYHAIVWGLPGCLVNKVEKKLLGEQGCYCSTCRLVKDCWPLGFSYVGFMDKGCAKYLAKYLTKGWDRSRYKELGGRQPEFSSKSPNIGKPFTDSMVEMYLENKHLRQHIETYGDIIPIIMRGRRKVPIPRRLKDLIRVGIGLPEGTPDHELDEFEAETFWDIYTGAIDAKIEQQEAIYRIFGPKGKL